MLWKPKQYRQSWDDFYASCDEDTQNTLDYRFDQLIEKGFQSRPPISKKLRDGIFELRGKDARALFYFGSDRSIVFVHGVIKKRGNVPVREIDLAIKRKKYLEEGLEESHEIDQPDQDESS